MSTPESPNRTLRNNRLSTTRQSTSIKTSERELGTTGATEACSYLSYDPPTYNPVNPVTVLEVASDGPTKIFNYEALDDLKIHLKNTFMHNGYASLPNQGRRVVLVTDIQETVLEALGDTYEMDFGLFVDHLLSDEHISYTSKTTRGSTIYILEEKNQKVEDSSLSIGS